VTSCSLPHASWPGLAHKGKPVVWTGRTGYLSAGRESVLSTPGS